ncbi:MAG: 50S ribosomal protein L14e [Candidatus Altiarchaeales archaeon]|nr:50S ribosomal protein L14e [Candidatus Altiarchaeales archaeon]
MTQGRVCRLTRGRDAGKTCIVLSEAEENKVKVVGPQIKPRQVNLLHLEPTPDIVDAGEKTTQEKATQLIEDL